MTLKSILQQVLVINLANKADRWERFLAGLPGDWPFAKPERFIATDGRQVPPPQWWQPNAAAWGCFRSHYRVLEQTLNDGAQSMG